MIFEPPLSDYWALDPDHVSLHHRSETLAVLKSLKADDEMLALYGVFHALRTNHPQAEEALALCSDKQKQIIDDLLKIHQADWLTNPKSNNAEGLRRLLFAMINDVRLVLILLAEQVVLMRAATEWSESWQKRLASSTMTYHAALANRLGVWQIKWELEDLSFRYLDALQYKQIAKKLAEKRTQREQFIVDCSQQLKTTLAGNNIEADIAGRPKHIYSIYKKMQKKNLSFEGLFDIRAVRVLVDSVADCYATLGIVHGLWPHVPKEFDDYIAQPKGNMYQSLHTVVMVQGKTLEVQIRTHDMHEHAELGVAAHWRYKDGSKQDHSYDNKVNWMRQLLNEHESDDLMDAFQSDTQEERIYVFTPNGDVVDLPRGSTAVDFAYHVHTEVGHRCHGAKVNGSIISLTRALQTGDRVEILTAKEAKPSRDWLNEHSGYLQSAKARAKVRHWFRENEFDRNQQIGKDLLDAELKRHGFQSIEFGPILQSFNLQAMEKLHAMIATGDITLTQILNRAEVQLHPEKRFKKTSRKKTSNKKARIIVEGVDDLKTTLASCCTPKPGEAIGGYITRIRGISVHRMDCDNYLHMIAEEPNRLINVRWDDDETAGIHTKLHITAHAQKSVIKDISVLMAHMQASILSLSADSDAETGLMSLQLVIAVNDFDQLSQIIHRASSLEQLIDIERVA